MIGLESIIDNLESMKDRLPATILLVGETGSGKHTVASYISSMMRVPLVDISSQITLGTLSDIYLSTESRIYLIDSSQITIKDQNSLLKVLEEPPAYSTFILLGESTSEFLDTVLNRCYVMSMPAYTKETLRSICPECSAEIIQLSNTPGQVIQYKEVDLAEYLSLSDTLFTRISGISYSNLLKLPTKFYYKDKEDNKLDFNLFVKILSAKSSFYYPSSISYKVIEVTQELVKKLKTPHVNKQMIFDNYLCRLRGIAK